MTPRKTLEAGGKEPLVDLLTPPTKKGANSKETVVDFDDTTDQEGQG